MAVTEQAHSDQENELLLVQLEAENIKLRSLLKIQQAFEEPASFDEINEQLKREETQLAQASYATAIREAQERQE